MKNYLSGAILACALLASPSFASDCTALPGHAAVKAALIEARNTDNGGLNLDMWGTVVDRSGTVCAIAYSGTDEASQWPISRVISAQKANTANGLSLKGLALSTANLYSPTQPGGSLFGLQESNPVDTNVAYSGDAKTFGTATDPLVGKRIGGVNVFGGGLALYDAKGDLLGGLGVSGDTSCADHNIAWRARHALKLDFVPAGVSTDKNDNIVYDVTNGKSTGGFGHVTCGGKEDTIAKTLAPTQKTAAPAMAPVVDKK